MQIEHLLQNTAVRRLQGLIESRFGKRLRILALADVAGMPDETASHFRVGSDLRIPIKNEQRYLCTAIIEQAASLSTDEAVSLSHLVRMILEPLFYDFYLQQMKSNSHSPIYSSPTYREDVENIEFSNFELSKYMEFEEGLSLVDDDIKNFPEMVFLKVQNPARIQKVALEIHEIKQKWAFLRFADIRDRISSAKDLISLGDITVLVDDLLLLTPEERQIFVDYARSRETGSRPMILIGLTSDPDQSVWIQQMGQLWIDWIKEKQLDIDRLPVETQKLRQALELFFGPAFEV